MTPTTVLIGALFIFFAVILAKFFFPASMNRILAGVSREPESPPGLEIAFGDVLQNLPTGLFILDKDHTIHYANAMFAREIEKKQEALAGQKLEDLFEVSEGLKQTLTLLSQKQEDLEPKSSRLTYSSEAGEKRSIQLSISRVEINGSDRFLCLVPSYKDLIAARDQIRQSERIRALGEMISGLAHEINNPLTGVIGFVNLLQEDERAKPIQNELDIIDENAVRCKEIIDNLLNFVRPGTAKEEDIDINELLRTSIKLVKRNLDIEDIEIETHLDPELPPVRANRTQIEEIFVNLLNNAEQELEQADPVSKLIRVSTRPRGNEQVAIRVEDTGRGIPPEKWDEIFDPFYTTKGESEGTGLGLSISKGIIEEMGGDIRLVNSSILPGACFEVFLPGSSGEQSLETQGAPEQVDESFPDDLGTILLIDDEESIRQLFEKIFDKYGVHGVILENPLEAIDWLERSPEEPAVIILDLVYPGRLKGRDLVHWIEDNAPHLLDQLIFITGNPHDSQIDYLDEHTSASLFNKPLDVDEVMEEASRLASIHSL